MKLFVTGGTGGVGTRVVQELIENGHEVVGLARSEASIEKLKKAGAAYVPGSLEDYDVLVKAAKDADGTVHLGFIHDFSNMQKSVEIDYTVTEKICESYIGTNKVFIYTAGSLYLNNPTPVDEDFKPEIKPDGFSERIRMENLALSYASKGVRSVVLRLGHVYGKDDQGFISIMANLASKNQAAYYLENGDNLWSVIHRDDAAVLYRLAIENAPAGSVLHGVSERVKGKDLAEAIGQRRNVKAVSLTASEIIDKLGPFVGGINTLNVPILSDKTQKLLGWKPTKLSIADEVIKYY